RRVNSRVIDAAFEVDVKRDRNGGGATLAVGECFQGIFCQELNFLSKILNPIACERIFGVSDWGHIEGRLTPVEMISDKDDLLYSLPACTDACLKKNIRIVSRDVTKYQVSPVNLLPDFLAIIPLTNRLY